MSTLETKADADAPYEVCFRSSWGMDASFRHRTIAVARVESWRTSD